MILKFDGDFEMLGFRVNLEVRLPTGTILIEKQGYLPPNPELIQRLEKHWTENYRSLSLPYRIKPEGIILQEPMSDRIQACRLSASQLCDCLKIWLDSATFRPLDKRLREELNREEAIQVLLRTENSDLKKLPLHLWDFFESYPRAELAFSPLETELVSQPFSTQPHAKVRILAILGHQQGINIESDLRLLQSIPDAELLFLTQPDHKQINDQLWEQSWDILFFAGHSQTQGETGKIYINPTDSLTLDELSYGLRKSVERGLKLAIFNSCDGLGLAQKLSHLNIPQVIVMREVVPDHIAQEFLKYFLTTYAQGEPLSIAVRDARERLQGLETRFPCATWLPIIHQHPMAKSLTWEELKKGDTTRTIEPQKLRVGFLGSLISSLLVLSIRHLGLLQGWELQAFDQIMQIRPDEGQDPRILLVEAAETAINQSGFPIPDTIIAQAIRKLDADQPRVIALDIFRDRPESGGNSSLAAQFQNSDRVVTACSAQEIDNPNKPGISPPPGVPESRLGYTDVVVDADGILRRHLMFMTPHHADPCATTHALSSRAALRYLAVEGIEAQTLSRDRVQIGGTIFTDLEADAGAYRRLDERGFQMMLNYRASKQVARTVQLQDVLEDRIQADWVQDKLVLMGMTSSTAVDHFSTPYSRVWGQHQKMPGVRVQAHMASQILSAALDKRPLIWTWSPLGEGVWIWGWSIVGGLIVWQVGRIKPLKTLALVMMTGITAIALLGICYGVFIHGGWIPLVPSVLALLFSEVSLLSYQVSRNHTGKIS